MDPDRVDEAFLLLLDILIVEKEDVEVEDIGEMVAKSGCTSSEREGKAFKSSFETLGDDAFMIG